MSWQTALSEYLEHKQRRIHYMNELDIPFTDDPQTDLEAICDFDPDISVPLRLHELTGKKNPLANNDIFDTEKALEALLPAVIKLIRSHSGPMEGTISEVKDGWELSFTYTPPEEDSQEPAAKPAPNPLMDKLLSSFLQENEALENFKQHVFIPSTAQPIAFTGILHDPQTHLYFVPKRKKFKIFSDYFRSLLGPSRVSSPIAETEDHYVLFDEGQDQETWLRNGATNQKQALLKHLAVQLDLENKIAEVSDGKSLKIQPYTGFITTTFTFHTEFTYMDEFTTSVITGREGGALRLARLQEMEERTYKPGTNPTIDNLLAEARRFQQEVLTPPELDDLMCYTNCDAQPSNYFVSGKINDLDKVQWASSLYMAARLFGHPVVQELGISNQEWFDHYAAQKGIEPTHKAFESFEGHIAWISLYNAITYSARHQDPHMADTYFRNAMAHLKDDDLRNAYVQALENSPHHDLLQRNLDVV